MELREIFAWGSLVAGSGMLECELKIGEEKLFKLLCLTSCLY